MQQATIHVRYVNEPKSPKGPASVKDAEDIYWKFWPNKIPLTTFKPDMTYQVGYTTEQYQGKEQRTITAVSLPDAAAPLTQIAKNGGPTIMPTQSTLVPASSPMYIKDEVIYCEVVIGRTIQAMGPAAIELTEAGLIALTNKARNAWAATFGQIPY